MTEEKQDGGRTRFMGLAISREVNVLALLAFVLSISSLVWQGVLMLRGSDLVVDADDTVNIVLTSNQGSDAPEEALQVIFNSYVSTVNEGAPGYDDTVIAIALSLGFQQDGVSRQVTYPWFQFEEYLADDATGLPITKNSGGAHQFVVPGQGHVGHHITFAGKAQIGPTDATNRAPITWIKFQENLRANAKMTLVYQITARSGSVARDGCELRVGLQQLETLRTSRATTLDCQRIEISD